MNNSNYDQKSEKLISDIILKKGWASKIWWDRQDWYIEWTESGNLVKNRLGIILLDEFKELDDSDKKWLKFMHRYFGL